MHDLLNTLGEEEKITAQKTARIMTLFRQTGPASWSERTRNWIKIKNPTYRQKEGRGDLFKRAG